MELHIGSKLNTQKENSQTLRNTMSDSTSTLENITVTLNKKSAKNKKAHRFPFKEHMLNYLFQ